MKIDKKIYSWAMYDWANSSFSTTVMAGFFPLFFKQFWSQGTDPTVSTMRLGNAVSIASLIIAILSPLLGAVADQSGSKKKLCFIFMSLGIFGTALLAWIPQGEWMSACIAYAIGMIGFTASGVFYDSLLPEIAPGNKANFASSLGYGLGYLGGGVLFTLNILMFLKPHLFGLRTDDHGVQAIQFSFLTVAFWWALFSIPLFKNVPEHKSSQTTAKKWLHSITHSLAQLKQTLVKIYQNKNVFYFLVAFWLYIDGVYTVITMAVDFGISIGFKSTDLITALLLVQYIGFPFALLFSQMAKWWGCKKPILICLSLYTVTVIIASQMSTPFHFYMLAVFVGMVQGGVQALSRSLFSQMIPAETSAEYFGLYNLVGKFASILGPAIVGWGAYLFRDSRMGILSLIILFIAGGMILLRVKEPIS